MKRRIVSSNESYSSDQDGNTSIGELSEENEFIVAPTKRLRANSQKEEADASDEIVYDYEEHDISSVIAGKFKPDPFGLRAKRVTAARPKKNDNPNESVESRSDHDNDSYKSDLDTSFVENIESGSNSTSDLSEEEINRDSEPQDNETNQSEEEEGNEHEMISNRQFRSSRASTRRYKVGRLETTSCESAEGTGAESGSDEELSSLQDISSNGEGIPIDRRRVTRSKRKRHSIEESDEDSSSDNVRRSSKKARTVNDSQSRQDSDSMREVGADIDGDFSAVPEQEGDSDESNADDDESINLPSEAEEDYGCDDDDGFEVQYIYIYTVAL